MKLVKSEIIGIKIWKVIAQNRKQTVLGLNRKKKQKNTTLNGPREKGKLE